MSKKKKEVLTFKDLTEVAKEFRKDLTGDHKPKKDLILMFAHNGTGKTRLSMEFKALGKTDDNRDTLYFNAFTEDLFVWNNDLENDTDRFLSLNKDTVFFDGLQDMEMENRIGPRFQKFVDLNFFIDYENYTVTFSRSIIVDGAEQTIGNIKISRGEENIFRWCFFLGICEIAMDRTIEAYNEIKYFYIDDPISSLDENNAITIACDLAELLREVGDDIKIVISTHHSLFFNIMFNELKMKRKCYYLSTNGLKGSNGYTLRETGDTPFFHHVTTLSELKRLAEKDEIYTYHFNALRTVFEKTASFFGYKKIARCVHGLEDEVLFHRAVQLLSHGKYSIFDPKEMGVDNKKLFKQILAGFLDKYEFELPQIFQEEAIEANN